VGHVVSRTTVLLEAIANHTHSEIAVGVGDAGLFRDIGERAVSVIMKERVARAAHPSGAALHRDTLVLARLVLAELRQVVEVVVHVIGDEEVQPAVIVIIYEGRSSRPSRVVYAGGPGNISERPITIISEEVVRSQTGDIEVIETIVIVIADGGAHSPAHVADTGLVRYIGKCPVAVVVIERAPGFSAGLHQVYAQ